MFLILGDQGSVMRSMCRYTSWAKEYATHK
jgi:hypothetical protein